MLDVDCLMTKLAKRRPIFHSEADFQHALAWRIHETMPDCQVRLEYPFPYEEGRMELDIWLPTQRIAIELKYRTENLGLDYNGESFALKHQGAPDEGRYDFLRDVQRLERATKDGDQSASSGFAVLLTNDPHYWKGPSPSWRGTTDAAFRIHGNRKITGELVGRIRSRKDPIHLSGCYNMHWKDYSDCAAENYGKFRYLAVSVQ